MDRHRGVERRYGGLLAGAARLEQDPKERRQQEPQVHVAVPDHQRLRGARRPAGHRGRGRVLAARED